MNREHKKKKQGNKPRYFRETMEQVAPGKASLVHVNPKLSNETGMICNEETM